MFKFRCVCRDPNINVEMSIFISTCNICVHSLEKYMAKSMYGCFILPRFNVFFDIYIEAAVQTYISACDLMQMS